MDDNVRSGAARSALSAAEGELIRLFRALSPAAKRRVLSAARALAGERR